jgi:hypothetical protein
MKGISTKYIVLIAVAAAMAAVIITVADEMVRNAFNQALELNRINQ